MGLLSEKHMATSVSLLILRTLASTLDSAYGLQLFLASGGYNKLVALAETAQLQTRTKFAISSLLSKCHLSELLTRLATATGVMGGAVNGHSSEGGWGWSGVGYGYAVVFPGPPPGSDTTIKHIDVEEGIFWNDSGIIP